MCKKKPTVGALKSSTSEVVGFCVTVKSDAGIFKVIFGWMWKTIFQNMEILVNAVNQVC